MDLTGKKLRTKTGIEIVVSKHDNYIHFTLNGEEKTFDLVKAFRSGFLSSDDVKLQEAIMKRVEEIEKENIEKERKEIEEQRLAEERKKLEEERKKQDAKFGKDYHVEYLDRSQRFTYEEVRDMYKITIYKGISTKKDYLVLISSIDDSGNKFVYHDRWASNGDYIYSGAGKSNDQSLSGGNLDIINSKNDGKEIHLFIKLSPTEYFYQGVFEYIDHTIETECDENKNKRNEYKFRLRKVKKHS